MADSKPLILVFVGMPGSGKGTCTDYLHTTYHSPVIHFGNMLYEEIQRRGLDNVKDENFVRKDMREKEGPAVLAKHVAKKANEFLKKGEKIIVLDGLYSWTEYKYLEEVFGKSLVVIATVAPKDLRRTRVLNRKDTHRKYTLEQLVAREVAEIEGVEKGGPIAYADYTLLNNKGVDNLLQQLEDILSTIKNNA